MAGGSLREVSGAAVLLTLALALAYPVFGLVGYQRHGLAGLSAAAVAGLVCWLSALIALLLLGSYRGRTAVVSAMLLGMLFRFGMPLCAAILLSRAGGELARAGVFGMILCYYLLALVVETLLSVWLVHTPRQVTGKAARVP